MTGLKRIYTVLYSVRLAVTLITFITITAALAACIPQARPHEFYHIRFGAFAPILIWLGFDRFFRSLLFMLPLALFALNLLLCTVRRIRRHRHGQPLAEYGPDLIHVGILLLIAAGLITVTLREERQIVLGNGQSARLPGEYLVTLRSFDTVRYRDGSPQNWRSELEISRPGKPVSTVTVAVNAPQRVGYMRLYQFSYGNEQTAIIGGGGREIRLTAGDRFSVSDTLFDVMQVDADAQSITIRNNERGITRDYCLGENIGGGVLQGFASRPVSVLMGVYDPGFFPALIALSLVVIGLGITFGSKIILQLKENE
ncbi:cytochrome c biogenesis protein ResB [archaeon]|nr:cytochrome c biogenesis protein ResB [archaeon]